MTIFKKFTDMTAPDDSCWKRDSLRMWSDVKQWDWDLDGVPSGLTIRDRQNVEAYKVVKKAQIGMSVIVDSASITNEILTYYAAGPFTVATVKLRGLNNTFLELPLPQDGSMIVTGNGLSFSENGGLTTVSMVMEYTGPSSVMTAAMLSSRYVMDDSQFRWTGVVTTGELADQFNFKGGVITYQNTIIEIADGSIELPVNASGGEYPVVICVDPITKVVEAVPGDVGLVGAIPIYKITMDGTVNPCKIVSVMDARTWLNVTAPDLTEILAAKADLVEGQVPESQLPSQLKTVAFTIGTGQTLIANETMARVRLPRASTLKSITVTEVGEIQATCTLDVLKASSNSSSEAASITGSTPPALTANSLYTDTVLTGWTPAFAAGDYLFVRIVNNTNAKKLVVAIEIKG